MKKTLLIVYVWMTYIVAAPLFLMGSVVMLAWHLIANVRDFGELDFKESVCAFIDGVRMGHKINMANVEYICEE